MLRSMLKGMAAVSLILSACGDPVAETIQGEIALSPMPEAAMELRGEMLTLAGKFVEESPELEFTQTMQTGGAFSQKVELNVSRIVRVESSTNKGFVAVIAGMGGDDYCHICAPYMFLAEFVESETSLHLSRLELLGKIGTYGEAAAHQIVKTGPGTYGVIVENSDLHMGITYTVLLMFEPGAVVHDSADVRFNKFYWDDAGAATDSVDGWTKIETTFRFATTRIVGGRYVCEFVRSEVNMRSEDDKAGELLKRDTLCYEYSGGAYRLP